MPKSSEKPQGKGKKEKQPKKKKKLILILLIVLVVLAGSAAGWYFFFRSPPDDSGEFKKASVEEKKTSEKQSADLGDKAEILDLGEVLVNLSGDGLGHYLRVKVVIEYNGENKKLATELHDKQPQIKDTLIATLRAKTLTEVIAAGAVEKIKESLLVEMNSILRTGDVNKIYFTDFLVQ